MTRSRSSNYVLACALATLTASLALPLALPSALVDHAAAASHELVNERIVFLEPSVTLDSILDAEPAESDDVLGHFAADETKPPRSDELPVGAIPLGDPDADADNADSHDSYTDPDNPDDYPEYGGYYGPDDYTWQVGPSGIIYRSYLAGPHEPRISITPFFCSTRTFWDATVGGRGGVLRYGDRDPLHPHGWQLDAYGASVVRMDAENKQDLVSADFVFGFPLTYGVGNWQYKMGYAHLSSHLGDEFIIRNHGSIDDRLNYVRDGIVFGSSWYPVPACRIYGEFDWAFHTSGGADPIHFQFGNELSHPGPTGLHGSPFLALNGRMREENNYGGDLTAQTGWLWRGETGKVFRLGGHYYNGQSSQSQFFRKYEEQIGMGLWYDF